MDHEKVQISKNKKFKRGIVNSEVEVKLVGSNTTRMNLNDLGLIKRRVKKEIIRSYVNVAHSMKNDTKMI